MREEGEKTDINNSNEVIIRLIIQILKDNGVKKDIINKIMSSLK